MIPFTPEWRAARVRQQQARKYVGVALVDPDSDDVEWLAKAAAAGDEDHARWELRYARMAIAVFVAERDALDDRTSSQVSAALSAALAADERIAADMRELAERQFADRRQGYREAFFATGGPAGAAEKLGRVLLSFASDGTRSAGTPLVRAAALLGGYVLEANAALRDAYGTASLPEHLPPSEVGAKR
ncbi:MAG: hypothetical protein O2973_05450 [Gemmatimonadetes bacterium]|nr:hypothetical protein [Gemmatimonadota bacterium]